MKALFSLAIIFLSLNSFALTKYNLERFRNHENNFLQEIQALENEIFEINKELKIQLVNYTPSNESVDFDSLQKLQDLLGDRVALTEQLMQNYRGYRSVILLIKSYHRKDLDLVTEFDAKLNFIEETLLTLRKEHSSFYNTHRNINSQVKALKRYESSSRP